MGKRVEGTRGCGRDPGSVMDGQGVGWMGGREAVGGEGGRQGVGGGVECVGREAGCGRGSGGRGAAAAINSTVSGRSQSL